MKTYLRFVFVVAVLHALVLPLSATTFNVTTDWSDISNPNGIWSYNSAGVPLTSTIRASDPWTVPQVSWGDLPGWFRSNGTELFAHDWLSGDVITHTGPTEIRWTSPESGFATITGAVWPTRDIGRFNLWEILLNNVVLTTGVIGSGDPYSRSSPFNYADGTGGAGVLLNIPITIGDVIELRLSPFQDSVADYAGATLEIVTASVPEPPTFMLFGLGVFGLTLGRKLKVYSRAKFGALGASLGHLLRAVPAPLECGIARTYRMLRKSRAVPLWRLFWPLTQDLVAGNSQIFFVPSLFGGVIMKPLLSLVRASVVIFVFVLCAAPAIGTPLRLDYSVTPLGGIFDYQFHLMLDNNDSSWTAGQDFEWIIFGDVPFGNPPSLTNFIGDAADLPVGPFTFYTTTGGGHNGPTFINSGPAPGWIPTAIGQSLNWSGTSTSNLAQGQLKWSNLQGSGVQANFVIANRVETTTADVPEPSSLLLFGFGFVGAALVKIRCAGGGQQ